MDLTGTFLRAGAALGLVDESTIQLRDTYNRLAQAPGFNEFKSTFDSNPDLQAAVQKIFTSDGTGQPQTDLQQLQRLEEMYKANPKIFTQVHDLLTKEDGTLHDGATQFLTKVAETPALSKMINDMVNATGTQGNALEALGNALDKNPQLLETMNNLLQNDNVVAALTSNPQLLPSLATTFSNPDFVKALETKPELMTTLTGMLTGEGASAMLTQNPEMVAVMAGVIPKVFQAFPGKPDEAVTQIGHIAKIGELAMSDQPIGQALRTALGIGDGQTFSPESAGKLVNNMTELLKADPKALENLSAVLQAPGAGELLQKMMADPENAMGQRIKSLLTGEGGNPADAAKMLKELKEGLDKNPDLLKTLDEWAKNNPDMFRFGSRLAATTGIDRLMEIKNNFEGFTNLLSSLPPQFKQMISGFMEKIMPTLGPMLDKMMPGASKMLGNMFKPDAAAEPPQQQAQVNPLEFAP